MDADPPSHDPITQFILDEIDFFGEESVKRGEEEPLQKFKEITDSFYETMQCLGTLKHEVALDNLKRGFKQLRGEAARGVRDTWHEFWSHRRKAKELKGLEDARRVRVKSQLQKFETILLDAKERNSPVANSMERAVEAFRTAANIEVTFSDVWERTSWITLRINGRLLTLYFGYLIHRFRVFLTFHAFIFLVPIAMFGIGYSLVSKHFVEYLSLFATHVPWLFAALTLAAYALKKYVLDKKLKKLQVRLETSLFIDLNVRLMMAQTLSLRRRLVKSAAGDASLELQGLPHKSQTLSPP